MRQFKTTVTIIGVSLACISCLPSGAFSADAPATANADAAAVSARAVIEKVTRDALEVLRDPKFTREEKGLKVRAIAEQTMDFETLSRLALGQHWRELNDAQHATFVQQFKKHVAATYGHTTDEYNNEDINVAGDQKESNGDWTVQTRIVGMKEGRRQEIAKVDYRLRQKDGRWFIIDVTIEGVSLMANFRSQFHEVMTNGGYEKLLKMLSEKNATVPQ